MSEVRSKRQMEFSLVFNSTLVYPFKRNGKHERGERANFNKKLNFVKQDTYHEQEPSS